MDALLEFWNKLQSITKLNFTASSKAQTGWNGTGTADVAVSKISSSILEFSEKGTFQGPDDKRISFFNVFRWTLDSRGIGLEHLRFGPDHPVYLFHIGSNLASIDAHLCGEDNYFGRVFLENDGFRFFWRVIGPKKNEEIDYYYSF